MELLQEYDFDFRYKKGADNIVPDALSRRPDHIDPPAIALNNLELRLDPGIRQHLIEGYPEDDVLAPIYERCLQGSPPSRYCLIDGLLCVVR
jgi:hypothetical protein